MSRRGGIIYFKVNGELYDAKGSFSYNLGLPKRESVVGADGIHGYTETPQVAFVEGEITDSASLNLAALASVVDATVTVELANGKVVTLRNAWFAAEGTGQTQEGNIGVRFESRSQGQET